MTNDDDSRNWSGLTLAEGLKLSQPMVPDEDDTVSMPVVGDNPSILPWQTDYRIELEVPNIGFVFASVMRSAYRMAKPWSGYVAVNADESFKDWFATAEEARAAVEEHIAAHVEANRKEA